MTDIGRVDYYHEPLLYRWGNWSPEKQRSLPGLQCSSVVGFDMESRPHFILSHVTLYCSGCISSHSLKNISWFSFCKWVLISSWADKVYSYRDSGQGLWAWDCSCQGTRAFKLLPTGYQNLPATDCRVLQPEDYSFLQGWKGPRLENKCNHQLDFLGTGFRVFKTNKNCCILNIRLPSFK